MKLRVMVLAMLLSMAPVFAAACDGSGMAKGAAHSVAATTAHSSQVAQKDAGAECPRMKEGACKHQCPHAKGQSDAGMTAGKSCCRKGKDGAMAAGKGCCKGKCPRAKGVSEKRI